MRPKSFILIVVAVVVVAGACHATAGGSVHALHYDIVSNGKHVGDAEIAIGAGGSRHEHFTFNDRGRGPDVSTALTVDAAGLPVAIETRGHDYWKADAAEDLKADGGQLSWRSEAEHGQAAAGGFFMPRQGPFDSDAVLARALLGAPDHKVALLPGGEARLEESSDVTIGGRTLKHVAIGGLGFSPDLIWLDPDGELFASVSPWQSTIVAGQEALIPELIAADDKWSAARQAALAGKLAHPPPAAGLAIVHANLFDVEREAFVPDATVVVVGDQIVAVGDAKTPVPAGAQVIDAHGRTLLPGLWDMHVHLGGDADGALDLAVGVTTVRDMGNDIDDLAARVKRYDAGQELGPHVLRAGIVDGPGPFSVPIGLVADDEAAAKKAVARYADLGYPQLKIYSSMKPSLVPLLASEAHARGMRVSGHIPSGMRAADAVMGGYDEIQHANFLMLQFLAKDGDDTRTPLRFTRVAEGGSSLDLASPEVTKFFDLLVAHKTVLDPTLVTFEPMLDDDPSDMSPSLAPWVPQLPAQIIRGGLGGGLPTKDAAQRATFRASFDAMLKMIALARSRGLRIVAGTDGLPGLDLPRELELYAKAGFPAPDVLALATIGAARVMGLDKTAGSIAAGKRADLLLIDGDPTRDLGAIRKADVVVCRGVVYDPGELFAAVGMHAR